MWPSARVTDPGREPGNIWCEFGVEPCAPSEVTLGAVPLNACPPNPWDVTDAGAPWVCAEAPGTDATRQSANTAKAATGAGSERCTRTSYSNRQVILHLENMGSGPLDCVLRSPPPESRFLAPEKGARNEGRNKPRLKYAIQQFVRLRRRAGGWPVLQTVTELSNGGASGAIIANYLAQSV